MPDDDTTSTPEFTTTATSRPRRRAASRPAGPPGSPFELPENESQPGPAGPTEGASQPADDQREAPDRSGDGRPGHARRRATPKSEPSAGAAADPLGEAAALVFQPPDQTVSPPRPSQEGEGKEAEDKLAEGKEASTATDASGEETGGSRRRRSRGGRRRKSGEDEQAAEPHDDVASGADTAPEGEQSGGKSGRSQRTGKSGKDKSVKPQGDDKTDKTVKSDKRGKTGKTGQGGDGGAADQAEATGSSSRDQDEQPSGSSRRRRRRRGSGDGDESSGKAAESAQDQITGVEGSTRIEAKRQRRREGREAGRKRAPILSESEFLARRESVDRVMAIRQRGETTQVAVLEDNVLVEHYVALESQTSLIGNVYLGRVQNVLPSMEAAFIDIGKGRNAVLYAGEVNWDLVGNQQQPRRIENALKPGQSVLVQVSKDPVGHKGARLTAQLSLPGRFLVFVPAGGSSGISRKLPDTERSRLKNLLKDILPDDAGVIIRTAAEGASEEELTRDVNRLTARWEDIQKKSKNGKAPQLLYAEPDTTLKVVRDLFTEDFAKLVVSGDDAWDLVDGYIQHVAPDLVDRLEHVEGDDDVFSRFRVDEQIAKALERKVWLPSGGSLVIDRTEAMTVVDVNTGKFTGSGGNLEETVTKNNLEAAEEFVRQLRLRDIGGIIVIDFIDMVLEDNRDLVLRRLVECLGRDRTRHQVAEVTSLGLVQMTRKRIGTGLVEAFSHVCETCHGRGVVIESEPVEPSRLSSDGSSRSSGKRTSSRRRGRKSDDTEPTREAATDDSKSRDAKSAAANSAEVKSGDAKPSDAKLDDKELERQAAVGG